MDNVYSSAYYDWKAPIRSLVLKENCNFALIFPKDVRTEMSFELYFFRVARIYPLERVYVLPEMASGQKLPAEGSTYLGEDGLGKGDDIFKMAEERPYRILHFGIGVYPKNLKVWKENPAGRVATGWSKITPTKPGDPFDYFDGNLSPFDEPTRVSETVMWLKGSVYFAFRNDEPITVTPKLHILGAGYDTWLLTDKAIADKMVKGVIPCRFISVGGLAEIQYSVPKEWEGKGFIYGLKDIMGLIRG
jgi:hypothetical protein